MRKILSLGLVAGVLVALAGVAPAQAHNGNGRPAPQPALLSVFHGVPGLTVDVYVNGALTVNDFVPGSFAGPLRLKAGTYSVAITAADAANASAPVIGPVKLRLARGGNYTAAAHLSATGAPTASLFSNDTSELARGDGRLTVRHLAAAPAVDVLANGAAAIVALTNPHEAVLSLPIGTISAAVAATGTTAPLIGPADIGIAKRTNTIVYAWGSLADSTLTVAVQKVDVPKHNGKKHTGKFWDWRQHHGG